MNKNNALTSGILMLSASWIAKSLGLLSTIILARLLTPNDFGLVAITMLVIHFLGVFAQTGSQQYLLSKEFVDHDDLNTAWSINLLLRIAMAILLFVTATPIAQFFEADITNVLRVSSLILIIIGLTNPATSLAKREYKYRGIFKLALLVKFVSFTITITIAYYTRSYWALIIGTICHYTVATVGSYFIYPYKPAFCLKNFHLQWDFSKWVLLRSFVGYIRSKGDAFVIAKFFSTSEVGVFSIAKELAMLIYEQVALPIAEIIITSVQKSKSLGLEINQVIEKYLLILVSLILPIICIISLLAENIVIIILGEKWLEAAPILVVLTLLGVSTSLTVVFNSTLTALKLTKLSFKIDIITTVIILSTLVFLKSISLVDFALVRALLDILVLLSYFAFTKFIVKLSIKSTIKKIAPTLLSGLIMAIALHHLSVAIKVDSFFTLAAITSMATIIYLATLLLLINIVPYKDEVMLELKQTANKLIKNTLKKLPVKFSN